MTRFALAPQVQLVHEFSSVYIVNLIPDSQFEHRSFLQALLNSQHTFVPGDQVTVPGTSEKISFDYRMFVCTAVRIPLNGVSWLGLRHFSWVLAPGSLRVLNRAWIVWVCIGVSSGVEEEWDWAHHSSLLFKRFCYSI